MSRTATVITLADFRDNGRTIRAFCSHYWVCSHDAQLRLELLAHHLGWDFNFYVGRGYLASRLYCSICGWFEPTFSLGHGGPPQSHLGGHSAGFLPLAVAEAAELHAARQRASAEAMSWVGTLKGGRKFGR